MDETTTIESKELDEDAIRTLLSRYVNQIITHETAEFASFINILRPQPQWQEKLHLVVAFTVKKSRVNKRALLLKVRTVKSRNFTTVSWRKGKTRKPLTPAAQHKRDLISAMRQAVRFQINKWRRANLTKKRCALCDSVFQIEVDHEAPLFNEMTSVFLSDDRNRQLIPTEFDYSRKTCGRKFRTRDALFSKRWKAYHKQHAKLRWLCKPCNLARKKKSVHPARRLRLCEEEDDGAARSCSALAIKS